MRGTENQNAVGNLVLHLNGNIRQWILSGVGGAHDARIRDLEFSARGGESAAALGQASARNRGQRRGCSARFRRRDSPSGSRFRGTT